MKRSIPMRGADEYDALTSWRRCYSWKKGVLKKIKRRFNKRERANGRVMIKKESEE